MCDRAFDDAPSRLAPFLGRPSLRRTSQPLISSAPPEDVQSQQYDCEPDDHQRPDRLAEQQIGSGNEKRGESTSDDVGDRHAAPVDLRGRVVRL